MTTPAVPPMMDSSQVSMYYDIAKLGWKFYNDFQIQGKPARLSLSAVANFKQSIKMDEAQTEVEKAFDGWKIGSGGFVEYKYEDSRFGLVTDFDCIDPEYDPENIGIIEEA